MKYRAVTVFLSRRRLLAHSSRLALFSLLLLSLTGCAGSGVSSDHTPDATDNEYQAPPTAFDPLEGMNRGVYKFNRGLDKAILRPVATAYRDYLPATMKTGVSNFVGFVDLPISIVSSLLQGKPARAGIDTARFGINATLGLFGLIDTAGYMGLLPQQEDFDQTFGVWGVNEGPYLMLPLFGPYTLRGLAGDLLQMPFSLAALLKFKWEERLAIYAADVVDTRAEYLALEPVLENAVDEYIFVREVYLQRVRDQVRDGAPPADDLPPLDDVPADFMDEIDDY